MRSGWVLVAVALAACGGDAPGRASARAGGEGAPVDGDEVTVFAAASLTEPFREAADSFRTAEGGRRVLLGLAGSQSLAAQLLSGAPADVFASADPVQMERVRDGGRVDGRPVVFAETGLAIAVERGNPREIRRLSDLARPGLAVVLGAPEVPVGRYARRALEAAGVKVRPVSLETDVKQVLAKVSLGEADAGIVYRSDVLAADGSVTGVELRPEVDQRARYRIAVVADGSDPRAGRRFVEFLRSPSGTQILRSHGFEVPGAGRRKPTPETERR